MTDSSTTSACLMTHMTVQLQTVLLMQKSGLLITIQIQELCNSYD